MAAPIENVVMTAGDCSLTLLPELGGKIASLHVAGHSLLQSPLNPLATRTRDMDFSESDASGWDECLPSVAACTLPTASGPAAIPVSIPDHGDLWRLPWQVIEADATSATLSVQCFSLPLELTRSTLLSETPSGWRLSLFYTLANRGIASVPWAWSAHPLFTCEPGDRILLPPSVKSLRLEGSGGKRIPAGKAVSWPIATLSDDSHDDLSLVKDPSTGTADKLFTGLLDEGWCALERPAIGLRLTLRFDPAATPYLGLWLCYAGWPNRPGAKQVCVALEPTTAPDDSLAEVISPGPGARTLAPGETFSWPMELEIDRIPQRNEANSV